MIIKSKKILVDIRKISKKDAEYVNKYRIERACLELLYSKKNITEIASDFGFNNIQYFSRVFKQYMNCTPKQFQKNGKM